ncbi:acylamino-acid-releasing enzyme-like [Ziziphus jujuba]|uniref:Acylamino-acid-releasing enzyme-like n=1 Tax=Ziziphus jujuba TaxID=326968 RepID=A0ABM4A3U1_ZIZJJ|nr:acylamino-acid-releasing enzyme-like [Ziziphus jujuba]
MTGISSVMTTMPPEYSAPFAASSNFFPIHYSPSSVLPFPLNLGLRPHSLSNARLSKLLPLMMSSSATKEEQILMSDLTTEEEYSSMSNLLEEFTSISNIDKTWIFKSKSGLDSQAMFLISQPSLLTNKRKKFILSTHISKESNTYVNFQWAPFPIEMTGVCIIVPSPSGSQLLVVRETDSKSPTQFEIWSPSQMEKEFHIPESVHGSIYTDGWFEGISWNSEETLVAYVAKEPSAPKPTFCSGGSKNVGSMNRVLGGRKGQGDFEDDWGESYTRKRQPALFVINTNRY